MDKNLFRGNEIKYNKGKCIYKEDGTEVSETWEQKPCGNCGKTFTKEGHDGCLGTLPGLMNACCGHGEVDTVYIQFLDGKVIAGQDALDIIEILKKYKEDKQPNVAK